eukprot:GSMAST32.ASY1.ANO1.2822.1 assembled CDS
MSGSSSFTNWFDEQKKQSLDSTPDAGSSWWPRSTANSTENKEVDVEGQTLLQRASTAVGLNSEPPPPACFAFCTLSKTDRMKAFTVLIIVSIVFFVLAFAVGLPMVILSPAKFALSFTLGSLSFMSAFAMLEGPWNHLQRIVTYERLPFTITYFLSMGATLYSSLILRQYVAVIFFSCLQVAALLFYASSYFPGGVVAMKFICKMFLSSVRTICTPILGSCGKSCLPI